MPDKLEIWKWVASTLASTADRVLEKLPEGQKFPLSSFIYYYLTGRDSVALSNLKDNYSDINKWIEADASLHSEKDSEARRFWLISALIEIGSLDVAEKLIQTYDPQDQRLWLGIYLGCLVNAEVRMTDSEQRAKAGKIAKSLESKVNDMRGLLLKEFRTGLLEMRGGKIAELEPPADIEDGKS